MPKLDLRLVRMDNDKVTSNLSVRGEGFLKSKVNNLQRKEARWPTSGGIILCCMLRVRLVCKRAYNAR